MHGLRQAKRTYLAGGETQLFRVGMEDNFVELQMAVNLYLNFVLNYY
jgi:hypothetical protein